MNNNYSATANSNNNNHADLNSNQQATIQEAIGILESRLRRNTKPFTSPTDVKQFCQLQIAEEKDEHFCCMFLDNQHRLIAFEKLFRGTIDSATVYPRVVVRRSIELNAGAVIFTHNHPSGLPNPSTADIKVTERLKGALALVDVRVLVLCISHFRYAISTPASFS
ncbi:MAG: DNA repair protein RadC [Pseudomonadales bacterium]|nr:DNA repair protein RadC [Pseudomonadales bacterium]